MKEEELTPERIAQASKFAVANQKAHLNEISPMRIKELRELARYSKFTPLKEKAWVRPPIKKDKK